MSRLTRIRNLVLSALTAVLVAAPGCDDAAEYEALGLTLEDLEVMSADELDALDEQLETGALDLSGGRLVTHPHGPHVQPEGLTTLTTPTVFTHTAGPQPPWTRTRPTPTSRAGVTPTATASSWPAREVTRPPARARSAPDGRA